MIKALGHRFVILFLGFTVGYIIRMVTASKPNKIVATTQVNNVTTQKKEVVTQAEVKKDSTTVKQTIVVRKKYDSKGKVTSETFLNQQVGFSTLENWAISSELSKNSIEQVSEKTKTITTYQPNWLGGLIFPGKYATEPSSLKFEDMEGIIEYRIIGNVYIVGMTNYKFTRPSIGALIPF